MDRETSDANIRGKHESDKYISRIIRSDIVVIFPYFDLTFYNQVERKFILYWNSRDYNKHEKKTLETQ